MSKKTICFVAGKSGGHIIPCLTLMSRYSDEHTILFISTNGPLDQALLANHSKITQHITIPLVSCAIEKITDYLHIAWHVIKSLLISFIYLITKRPAEIITTGGIVAIPVCCVAYILRIPITLYVLDAVPGRALTALAPCATTINFCFPRVQHYFVQQKSSCVAYPIKFTEADRRITAHEARTSLGLDIHKKTVLFLGGSQGSEFLNICAEKFIEHDIFSHNALQIIHQTGGTDTARWVDLYTKKNITHHVFTYSDTIASMYSAADYILCRAGSGTLHEILFFKKRCFVIPLKTKTTTHQINNARAMAHAYPDFFECLLQEDIEKKYDLLFMRLHERIFYQNFDAIMRSHI